MFCFTDFIFSFTTQAEGAKVKFWFRAFFVSGLFCTCIIYMRGGTVVSNNPIEIGFNMHDMGLNPGGGCILIFFLPY